jgi:DNA polymerase-3 subunit beta
VEVVYGGPSLEVGFNSRYLMEALNVMDTGEVFLELKDEGSPVMIRPASSVEPSNQVCIIMPMRI